ncbi:uncharacterized protein ACNLHF_002856 isoform 1-T3 [Anomaloglossus baeobatrachus]
MKTLVALLCMVSVLVGSVYSVRCYFCVSKNSPTCDPTIIACKHRCMTQSTHNFNDKNVPMVLLKGCTTDNSAINCGKKIEEKSSNGKSETFMSCCSRNLCNTDGYAFGSTPSFSTTTQQPSWIQITRKKIKVDFIDDICLVGRKK